MKTKFFLLIFILPLFSIAQVPKEIDPLGILPEEAKAKRIQAIECTTRDYEKGVKEEDYEVELASFYENGYANEYHFEDYQEGRLVEEQVNINKYLFEGDSIREKYFEEFSSSLYYAKTHKYENDKLMETKVERAMSNDKMTKYEYYPDGKLAKKIYISRYAAVDKYIYDGDRLIKILYYFDEDDEDPETVTNYKYSNQGGLIEVLEARFEDQDTIKHALYDGKGRITYLKEERKLSGNNFSPNEPYKHVENYFYSDAGQLDSMKFLLPLMFQPNLHVDSLIWLKVKYQYKDDQMISFDSAGVHYAIEYTDFEEVAKITATKIRKGDTLFIEDKLYNDQQQLMEVKNWNFDEEKGFKWRYTYEGNNRVMEDYFVFASTERCTTKHEFDGSQRRLVLSKYCGRNSRRLPENIPMEVIDAYFDQQGNLIKETVKYGNHDGSIVVSYIDSFYYEKGSLVKYLKDEFRGGQSLNFDETYYYDKNGLLAHVYGGYKADTLLYKNYFYENGNLVSSIEKIYSLRGEKKYLINRLIIKYNQDGQFTEKLVSQKEEASEEEFDFKYSFQYNADGLLIQRSYFSKEFGKEVENRKSYKYFFFPN